LAALIILGQYLLIRFFEGGVEIMSPHIYAHRSNLDLQVPPEFKQEFETPQNTEEMTKKK
jgi:hypothetical protein